MDIEEFYDGDPRRRPSAEIEMGTEWRDSFGVRYEINWVAETGELYSMRELVPAEWEDPFGGYHVDHASADGMTIAIVANIASQELLEQVMSGWEQQIDSPNSVSWLVDRLGEAGVAVPKP
jgi:hypothetical protein